MWRAGSQRGDCDNSKVRRKSVSGLVREGEAGTAFKLRVKHAEIEGSRTSKVFQLYDRTIESPQTFCKLCVFFVCVSSWNDSRSEFLSRLEGFESDGSGRFGRSRGRKSSAQLLSKYRHDETFLTSKKLGNLRATVE